MSFTSSPKRPKKWETQSSQNKRKATTIQSLTATLSRKRRRRSQNDRLPLHLFIFGAYSPERHLGAQGRFNASVLDFALRVRQAIGREACVCAHVQANFLRRRRVQLQPQEPEACHPH